MATKWFFPGQEVQARILSEEYTDYQCNWQEVNKDRVIEHITAKRKDNGLSVNLYSTIVRHGKSSSLFIDECNPIAARHV